MRVVERKREVMTKGQKEKGQRRQSSSKAKGGKKEQEIREGDGRGEKKGPHPDLYTLEIQYH